MVIYKSCIHVQNLAGSPQSKKRGSLLPSHSPHQNLSDNQLMRGSVMDTQISPSIPSGLTVIHPARSKSSAAVRRLDRERQHAKRVRSYHNDFVDVSSRQSSISHPLRSAQVPQSGASGRVISLLKNCVSRRYILLLGLPLLTLAALIVLGAITVLAPRSAQAGTSVQTTPVTKVVTVKAEQTLWDIAHEADSETDPRDTIVRIIKLNDLQNTTLQAGQRLEVPVR